MKKYKKYIILSSIIAASFISMTFKANAAYYENQTFKLKQPDNSEVEVKVTGDEYYQHIESLDGYTLCRNEDGWICYADIDADGEDIIASSEVYTGDTQNRNYESKGRSLRKSSSRSKHIKPSEESIEEERNKVRDLLSADESEADENRTFNEYLKRSLNAPPDNARSISRQTEEIKGSTLLIDFS